MSTSKSTTFVMAVSRRARIRDAKPNAPVALERRRRASTSRHFGRSSHRRLLERRARATCSCDVNTCPGDLQEGRAVLQEGRTADQSRPNDAFAL
jgi:hypothetical protein